jgi:pilus assembly protein CpaF
VDVLLHLRRAADGRRYVAELHLLRRGASGLVETVEALRVSPRGELTPGPADEQLRALVDAGGSGG